MVKMSPCHGVRSGFDSRNLRQVKQIPIMGKLDWVASIPVRVGHEDLIFKWAS